MSKGNATFPVNETWKALYEAALFETDKSKLSERIAHAERALALRARELFHTDEEHLQERQAVDSASYSLYALGRSTLLSNAKTTDVRTGKNGAQRRSR